MNGFPLDIVVDPVNRRNKQVFLNGQLWTGPVFSPSAVSTYRECPRKWAWVVIGGQERVTKRSQKVGLDEHGHLEKWLRHAVAPPTNSLLIGSNALLRFPQPDGKGNGLVSGYYRALNIERPFAFVVNGMGWYGFKDVEAVDNDHAVIWDLKTKRDLAWKLSPAALASDLQGSVYAVDQFVRGIAGVTLRWVWVQTSGAKVSDVTEAEISPSQAFNNLAEVEPACREMAEIKRNKSSLTVLDITPNYASCGNYGGCDFLHLCERTKSATATVSSLFKHSSLVKQVTKPQELPNMSSFLDFVRQEKARMSPGEAAPPAPAQPAPAQPAQPAPAVQPAATGYRPGGPPANGTAPSSHVQAAPVAAPPPTPAPAPAGSLGSLVQSASLAQGVNPPDAAPYDPHAQARAAANANPAGSVAVAAPAVVAAPVVPAVHVPQVVQAQHEEVAVAAAAADTKPKKRGKAASPLNGLVLYVDCCRIGGAVPNIDELIAPLRAVLDQQLGQAYRLLDYSKGAVMLSVGLEEVLRTQQPTGEYWCSRLSVDKEVMAVLERYATVIRAI